MSLRALELKVPPLALVLAFAAALKFATRQTPALTFAIPGRGPIFIACAETGASLGIAGIIAFRKVGNSLAFLFLPAFVAYMNRFQIDPEERMLMEKFGARYVAYKQTVRRWR